MLFFLSLLTFLLHFLLFSFWLPSLLPFFFFLSFLSSFYTLVSSFLTSSSLPFVFPSFFSFFAVFFTLCTTSCFWKNDMYFSVCRHGLKVITPEETFTLLASSPMEKVDHWILLQTSFPFVVNQLDSTVWRPSLTCACFFVFFLGKVASLHQPGGGSGPEWSGTGHGIDQLGVVTEVGASDLQNGLVHFL